MKKKTGFDEESGFRELSQAVKPLKNLKIELTTEARRELARLCRDAGRESAKSRPWLWLTRPLTPLSAPWEVRLAAGALALFLATVGLFWFTGDSSPLSQLGGDPAGSGQGVSEVQLVSVAHSPSGGVELQWRDGKHRVYRVLKSTDPRDFGGAEVHAVRGNGWIDERPTPGGVVYYKVE